MKLSILVILLFNMLISIAQAQMEFDDKPSDVLKKTISLNEYEVSDHQIIEQDGKQFSQITFEKKVEFDNENSILADSLILGTAVTDTIVAAKFFGTDPRQDKLLHFYAGYLVGNVTNGAFQLILPKTMKNRRLVSALLGVGMSALVGGAKEFYDSRHPENHTVDAKDFWATVGGGMVGSLTLTFDLNKMLYGNKR
jgi:uncharacterized protein YfiM (DUF2279 family)